MKLLFICNTVYQIIAASSIRKMYSNDRADIILTDHSVGHTRLYERMKDNNLIFDKVYYAKTKSLLEMDLGSTFIEYKRILEDDRQIENIIQIENKYDMVFYANEEPFPLLLINYLKN